MAVRILIFNILFLTGSCFPLFAQNNKALSIGISGTANTYHGDFIESPNHFLRVYPGMNVSLQFERERAIQFKVNLGFGKFVEQRDLPDQISAPSEVIPNIYTSTTFRYAELQLAYYLRKEVLRPYISAGAGLFQFTPKDEAGSFLSDAFFTRPDGETYSNVSFSIPLKLGLEYWIQASYALHLGYTYRLTSSDFLDNLGSLGERKGNDALSQLELGFVILLKGD